MSDQIEFNPEDADVALFVKRRELGYLLSCLLHAKFNDDIKLEVVLHPVLNRLISDVIEAGKGSDAPPGFWSDQDVFVLPKKELENATSVFYRLAELMKKLVKPNRYDETLEKALYPYVLSKSKNRS